MRGFSEALRRELADSRIRVHYVAPRATRTALATDRIRAMNEELNVGMDTPEDVARAVESVLRRERRELLLGRPERLFAQAQRLVARPRRSIAAQAVAHRSALRGENRRAFAEHYSNRFNQCLGARIMKSVSFIAHLAAFRSPCRQRRPASAAEIRSRQSLNALQQEWDAAKYATTEKHAREAAFEALVEHAADLSAQISGPGRRRRLGGHRAQHVRGRSQRDERDEVRESRARSLAASRDRCRPMR